MKHLLAIRGSIRSVRFFVSVLSLLFFSPISSFAEVVDRVVAVVNQEIITLSELEEELSTLPPSLLQSSGDRINLDGLDEIREKTLDNLIDLRLIEQKAKQFNISVSEQEIDKAFDDKRQRMGLEPTEFKTQLLASGLTEEVYRKKLRANILQQKVISIDVRSKIVITDEMIQDYYDQEYTTAVGEDSFYLLQMGFTWENSDQPETLKKNKTTARQLAERILKLAREGQNFGELARKFSDLPSASDGGDIGVFALDEMAPAMKTAVQDLQPGEISNIIETSSGFQFFKLAPMSEGETVQTVALESVEDEIRRTIGEQKMKESFSEWVRNLKDQAYIQKM